MPDKCKYLIEHLEMKYRYTFNTSQPLTRGFVCDWEVAYLFFLLSCLSASVTFFLVASAAASLGSSSSASKHSKWTSSHFKGLLSYHAVSLPSFVLIFSLRPSFCCLLCPHLVEAVFTAVSASSLVGESGEHLSN